MKGTFNLKLGGVVLLLNVLGLGGCFRGLVVWGFFPLIVIWSKDSPKNADSKL